MSLKVDINVLEGKCTFEVPLESIGDPQAHQQVLNFISKITAAVKENTRNAGPATCEDQSEFMETSNTITLIMEDSRDSMQFVMRRNQSFQGARKAFAGRTGLPEQVFHMIFDNKHVTPDQTPEMFGLKDGDRITMFAHESWH